MSDSIGPVENPRALLGRVLALEQQVIDLRARLDREHQAGEGFLRFSERALPLGNLMDFWELATEEAISTFGAENALLLRLDRDGDDASVCATCCADGVTREELRTLAACVRRALADRVMLLDRGPLPPLLGQETALLLVGGVCDRTDDGTTYALVASVSAARRPFYPSFDATLGPLYAAFVNHLGALQQHIRGRVDSRKVSRQVKRLADVANRTSNAVVITDREGRVEWVNEGFVRLTGWTLAEIVGQRPEGFVEGPGTDPTARQRIADAVAAFAPVDLEVCYHARSGRPYWVQVETRVTYDDHGEPTGFVTLHTDVTERRFTERREGLAQRIAALLLGSDSLAIASERLVSELVVELGVQVAQIWSVEPHQSSLVYLAGAAAPSSGEVGQRFLDTSRRLPFHRGPEAVRSVGMPGKAWHLGHVCFMPDITDVSPQEGRSRRLGEALEAGVTVLCEAPILGPTGVLGVLEVGSARTHPGNNLLATTLERVAEQVAAFMLHNWSRRAFRSIFDHSPDGLLLVDDAGRVQTANARAQVLFGEALGGALDDILEGGSALVRAALDAPGVGDPAELFHREARGPEATTFSAEVSVSATPSWSTQTAIIAVRDVTEHRRTQEALTQSLREKETLLKEIHHRVKNNLQIISSLLTMQVNQMPSNRARELLEESVHRVRSMALIHQQLYGAQSLERIDLGAYARQLAETLRSALCPTARLRIDSVVAVEVTVEHAVPIGLILNELLTNAFKYGVRPLALRGAEPDVVVTLTLDDGRFELTVRDAGPGLPPNFSAAASPSLGLKLVRSLTRQVRGTLDTDSDHGARFRLRCPLGRG